NVAPAQHIQAPPHVSVAVVWLSATRIVVIAGVFAMKVRATFLTPPPPFFPVPLPLPAAFPKNLPLSKPPPPTQAYAAVGPLYSWSGFYFGASLGAARVRTRADDSDAINTALGAFCAVFDPGKGHCVGGIAGSGGSVTYSDTGMIFGLTTGWNQQT